MSWNSFKDLADKAVNKKGIGIKIQESLVLESANRVMLDILSEKAKDKMSAVYFKNGTLTIAALNDDLLKRLISQKGLFIATLNSKLGDSVVKDLSFLS